MNIQRIVFYKLRLIAIFCVFLIFPIISEANEKRSFEELTDVGEYIYEVDNNKIFKIRVYTDFSYYYVDIKEFLDLLKIENEKIDSQNSFRFNLAGQKYIVNPQEFKIKNSINYTLSKLEYIPIDDENFFIEISAFARIFKVDIRADHQAKKILGKSLEQKKKKKKPVAKVYKNLVKITDENINEDNLLVLEIRIDDMSYDELIDAYRHDIEEGAVYFSLNQLVDITEFPIEFEDKKAKGWFIKEENNFILDITKNYIEVKNNKLSLNSKEYFYYNDEIYIIEDKLKQWFPLDYTINLNAQYLKLEPLVLLPFQEKKSREVKRKVALRQNNKKDYEKVIPEYSIFDYPQGDITIDMIANGSEFKDEPDVNTSYSGFLISEAGKHTNKLFFAGNKDRLTGMRLAGSKLDPENNLFEKGISQYSFGDIASAPLSLINGATLGRGFKVSTYDINRSDSFSRKSFEGNINPGWEVELYRNDQLLDFQTVGSNGRYLFQDVEVLYGENVFKLIFYGPQGQVKEEIQRINVDDNLLKKGDYNYLVSFNQKGKGLFNIGSRNQETLNRAIIRGEYGFTKKYTFNSAFAIDEYLDTRNQKQTGVFQSLSFVKEVFGFLNNVDLALDYTNFSYALRQNAVTNYNNTNISFSQVFYQNYFNEDLARNPDPTKWRGDANINKVLSFKNLKNLSLNFNIAQEVTRSLRKISSITNNFNVVYKGYILANSLTLRKVSDTDETLNGNFNIRTNQDNSFLRLGLLYDVIGQNDILNAVSFSYQTQTDNSYILRGDVNQSFQGEKITSFNASVNKEYKELLFGFNTSYDTNNNYQAGFTITFSLNKLPNRDYDISSQSYSNSGAATAFAFLDDNLNSKFDKGEEIIDAKFKKGNRLIEEKDGKITKIQELASNSFSDISIDLLSLEDPLWYPAKEGYSVFARPSKNVELKFPVNKTFEVDGIVNDVDEEGNERPISGLKIHLINNEGKLIKTVTSEFDGYYMFEKVVKGEYTIIPDEEQINKLFLSQDGNVKVNVDGSEDFYTDNYISLIAN